MHYPFPSIWAEGIIVPIFKKGDKNDPANYRGITLVSCLGKLFNNILNERLKSWATENNVITDAQFGFKADHSTVDAIFILQSLIDKKIKNKKKLYCAFVDLKRAFDSVYRNGLWFKLIKNGVDGKILKIIRSMYSQAKSCVRHFGSLSDFFKCDVGLLQGEIISPILFSLFLADLETFLQIDADAGITLEQISIYLLMFADDAVIFSETVEGLQTSIDNLRQYCDKWNLTVNISKTKIVVFRKGGPLSQQERWTYGNEEIEIVNNFNYLGVVLSSGGSFIKATSTLSGKALKAANSLLQITKDKEVPVDVMFGLFDSFVTPILNYACEVWGFIRADNIERVHRKFCKWVLNVKPSTSSLALYGEVGRFPLLLCRQSRIVKYFLKINSVDNNNCILWNAYTMLKTDIDANINANNWASNVKKLLERSGFPDVWLFPNSVNLDRFLPLLKLRLKDMYIAEWREGVRSRTSLMLYREIKNVFEISEYLLQIKNRKYRQILSKIRLSSHQLAIEKGRHINIERNQRKCPLCTSDIEDEFHFILICPEYIDLRKTYIHKYFYTRPSMYKLTILLTSTKSKQLKNLAIYLLKAFKVRTEAINIVNTV